MTLVALKSGCPESQESTSPQNASKERNRRCVMETSSRTDDLAHCSSIQPRGAAKGLAKIAKRLDIQRFSHLVFPSAPGWSLWDTWDRLVVLRYCNRALVILSRMPPSLMKACSNWRICRSRR